MVKKNILYSIIISIMALTPVWAETIQTSENAAGGAVVQNLQSLDDGDEYSDLYDEEAGPGMVLVPDPLYYLNLSIYHFNDTFYVYLLEPVSKGYGNIIPQDIRTCVDNFFYNMAFPIRFVNNILQWKVGHAGGELACFLLNSTAGCFGLADLSESMPGLKPRKEDLGQTLGWYGIGNGFFLQIPFLGPSTLRDAVGMAGDSFLHPFAYIKPVSVPLAAKMVSSVNKTSFRIGDYQALKDAAVSPYEAFRDAYIQYRIGELNR